MQKIEKVNTQAALQACTRATKASKDNQDIKMIDDTTTGKDSTVDIHFPPHSCGKAKCPSQIKISSKYRTAITETLLGNPLPGSQANVKGNGHKPDSGDIGIYEFLIEGAPNPPDLEGIEEDQLLQIQQNIQDKLKQRDEEREKNITKSIAEMTQTDHPMASAKVKSADKWSCCNRYFMAINLKWQNNTMKDLINTLSFKLRAAILRIQL